MFNKAKIGIVFIMIFSCIACSANRSDNEQNRDAEIGEKPNFKKAALLNIELGQHYLAQGQISRAKKKFLHALKLYPNLAEAHSGLGYFFEAVGENKLAEKHYQKAIFLGGKNGLFHNNYGTFLCGQNRYKEADKEFLIAIKDYNYTKTADVYENAGFCALKAKDLQKAENYFKVAVRHDPKQYSSLIELAEISFGKHELNQARDYLNRLRAEVKPSPRILLLSIKIAKQSDDKDSLASDALLLKNLFPNSEEYKLYLKTL